MDVNPYCPPSTAQSVVPKQTHRRGIQLRTMIGWPFVVALNCVTPLLFGFSMLNAYSSIGVAVAIAAFIVMGWAVVHFIPRVGRILFVGSIVSSLSQLFPIVQIMAGSLAFSFAMRVGQAEGDFEGVPHRILTVLGGLIVSGFTGMVLFILAMISGAIITSAIPRLRFSTLPSPTS